MTDISYQLYCSRNFPDLERQANEEKGGAAATGVIISLAADVKRVEVCARAAAV